MFSLKSWLFTPATRADRFHRASEGGASALIIDLEDAIAPNLKTEARTAAISYLESSTRSPIPRALRINAPNTKMGLEDLHSLVGSTADPDYLILPKSDSPGAIAMIDSLLKEAGKSARIIAMIETARGVTAAEQIATQTPRPAGLLFGAADLAADLGSRLAWEPLLLARSRVVIAASLAGIAALDSPWFDLADNEGLMREAQGASDLGFHGKTAIHPKQTPVINAAFTPTDEEIEKARRVLDVSQNGAGVVDGQMVDEASARRARLILARAGLHG